MESVRIEWMLRDLLAGPHKKWIINVECTAGKRQQTKHRDSYQQKIGMLARPLGQKSFLSFAKAAHHRDGGNLFRSISLTVQEKGSWTDSKSGAGCTEVIR
jgi:hypothetical protein